jgi:hypothetical protein
VISVDRGESNSSWLKLLSTPTPDSSLVILSYQAR